MPKKLFHKNESLKFLIVEKVLSNLNVIRCLMQSISAGFSNCS